MYQHKLGTLVCSSTIVFQSFSLIGLGEPNKFGRGITPYSIPPFWASPFYSSEIPGIGLISLAKSAGFGRTSVELFRLGPETEYLSSIVTPKSFLFIALPRIYSVAYIFG